MSEGTCLNCNCVECHCDEEDEELPQCMECSEDDPKLLVNHPEYSGDKLCRECAVAHWETQIEEAENEIEKLKEGPKPVKPPKKRKKMK